MFMLWLIVVLNVIFYVYVMVDCCIECKIDALQ